MCVTTRLPERKIIGFLPLELFLQIQDDMKFHEGEKRAENGTREMSLAYGGHILMHEIPMINISASIPVPVWLKLISVAIRRRLSNKVDKLLLTFRKLLRTRCCSFDIKNNQ